MKNMRRVNLAQISSRDDKVFMSSGEEESNKEGEQSIADLTSNAKEQIKNSIANEPKKEETESNDKKEEPKKEQDKKESEGDEDSTDEAKNDKKEDKEAKKVDLAQSLSVKDQN